MLLVLQYHGSKSLGPYIQPKQKSNKKSAGGLEHWEKFGKGEGGGGEGGEGVREGRGGGDGGGVSNTGGLHKKWSWGPSANYHHLAKVLERKEHIYYSK